MTQVTPPPSPPPIGGYFPEPISSIVIDDAVQARFKVYPETIQKYRESYAADIILPPVKVAMLGGTTPVLVDGWHRIAALKQLGRTEVMVEVVSQNATMTEIKWLAADANTKHGRPLTRKEMENVFVAYVKAGKHKKGKALKSLREVARDLGGRSHHTISKWMKKHFPKLWRQYRRDETPTGNGGLMPMQEMADEAPTDTFYRYLGNAVLIAQVIPGKEVLIEKLREAIGQLQAGVGEFSEDF